MRASRIATAVLSFAVAVLACTASAATFGGYQCTEDCSGHAAGYRWAEEKDVDDPADCPTGHGNSFHEGCLAYSEDPSRGADEDDDGNEIDK
jgi:hypothetical protein